MLRLAARTGVLAVVPVPSVTGARVRFAVEPGGGDSGILELLPSLWSGGRTLRYEDRMASAGGIARVILRSDKRGWALKLHVRGPGLPLDLAGASRVEFTIDFGEARWCGEVTGGGIRERRRLFVGRSLAPMRACPCDPLPLDTFQAIEQRIFARHTCTAIVCHGGVPGRANLTLVSGLAYDALVGVPSTADSTILRVDPGAPDASMLLLKVNGGVLQSPLWGMPMPISGRGPDVDEVEAIRLWIAAGAPRTGTIEAAQALLSCQIAGTVAEAASCLVSRP